MRKIVVAGGGIGGVETALTLARGLDDVAVTLIGQWPSLRIVPNLVYVPFGIAPQRLDVALEAPLAEYGITLQLGTVERVDHAARRIEVDGAFIDYDVLVCAPGTVPQRGASHQLRTLEDALILREALEGVVNAGRGTIVLRILPNAVWAAPGYEMAFLVATWLDAIGAGNDIDTVLATHAHSPFSILTPEASTTVTDRLERHGVELLAGIPPGRVAEIEGTVEIDLGSFAARKILGLPPVNGDGFYAIDEHCRLDDDLYIVGDASRCVYKAGFATAWEARLVLESLGGSIDALGDTVDGIPVRSVEYQMDMGSETMHVLFEARNNLIAPYVDPRANVSIVPEPPDKLQGTLTKALLLPQEANVQTSRTFRELIQHELPERA